MARKPAPAETEAEIIPTQFRNVSPLGALDVPALHRIIHPQEVFAVHEDVARLLIEQPEHFAPADGEPLGLPNTDSEEID